MFFVSLSLANSCATCIDAPSIVGWLPLSAAMPQTPDFPKTLRSSCNLVKRQKHCHPPDGDGALRIIHRQIAVSRAAAWYLLHPFERLVAWQRRQKERHDVEDEGRQDARTGYSRGFGCALPQRR